MPTQDDLQPPPELRAQWKKPFKEQVDYFRQRLNMPTQHWDDVRGNQHDKAFVVAGAQKAELLTDFRQAADRAVAQGQTLDAFRKDFDKIVAQYGWQHTGDRRWRAKVIYEGNLLSSHGAGREAQLQNPELQKLRPYRTRRHSHTSRVPRQIHLSWDGITLPHDHPWVLSHPAPCGWGCHCRWTAASRAAYREAQADGRATGPDDGTYQHVDRWGEVHVLPKGVDYGWSHTPGATWLPDMRIYPVPVARDLAQSIAEQQARAVAVSVPNRQRQPLTRAQFANRLTESRMEARDDVGALHDATMGMLDPVAIRQMLTGTASGRQRLEIALAEAGQGGVRVSGVGKITAYEVPGVEVDRVIYAQRAMARHTRLVLPDAAQGAGVAKRMMAATVEEYMRMGITRIELTANMQAGGYAWARYGFSVTNAAWLDEMVAARMLSMDAATLNPKALAEWQAVKATVQGHPRGAWVKSLAAARTPALDRFLRSRAAQQVLSDAGLTDVRQITAAKFLLMGTSWEGRIDLSDTAALSLLLEYLRG